jgi:hypothetical protein
MDIRSAQIATVCECIDHCFAFAKWRKDFAPHLDPEDMIAGLDRSAELMSDASHLMSFLALRKLDDFLRATKAKKTDLIASDLGVDANAVLGDAGETLLTKDERELINTGVAHLTEQLSLDHDGEVDLDAILKRVGPVLLRLEAALRKADTKKEATQWLDKTSTLIKSAEGSLTSSAQTSRN